MTYHVRPTGETVYPETLKERDWWVNWVLAVRHDDMQSGQPSQDAKATKQPVAPYDNGTAEPCRWNSGIPEEEHPRTSFEDVQKWDGWSVGTDVPAPDRVVSDELGIGIIIPVGGGDAKPITLLDWDDVRDPETGEVHPVCAEALLQTDGYAEISQSGEGIHQFVFGEIPGGLSKFLRHIDNEPFVGDDLPMVEMYSSGRLTAMTGQQAKVANEMDTGTDVVEGQDLIDELCWRFGTGSNTATDTPTDPFAGQRDDGTDKTDETPTVPSHSEVGEELQSEIEFDGDSPDSWDIGDDESVKYAAVLRGRERSDELTNTANWELIGWVATIGHSLGKSKDEIIADLEAHPTPQYGFDEQRARREVRREYQKTVDGNATVPSVERLKNHGLLPTEYVDIDELRSDDSLSGKQKWQAWSNARETGKVGENSIVPDAALEYLARKEGWYDFSNIPDDAPLPPKAHNKALGWVKNTWWEPETHGYNEDAEATVRNYKSAVGDVFSWEDVRYIYDNATKNEARKAARDLLSERYDLMTLDSGETLHVYNADTGIYTDDTAILRAEIYDGLGDKWARKEKNEIVAGLRQQNTVHPSELNGRRTFDQPHICVKNGVLNLFTGELKPHDPEYYFVDRVPVDYDENADTEPYENFLDELTGREKDKEVMLEMVGHAIVPDAHERKWKNFLILTGDSDNGKSVFYDRVRDLLDGPNGEEENVASVTLSKMSENDFSKHSMYGHMANIAGEVNGKKIRKTADIKDITGGDKMELEPKGRDSFFDTVNTTLMFAANDPPIIGERDKKAIATRIVPVELPHTFTEDPSKPHEKQKKSESELESELATPEALSGLLNLALDGIQRLKENDGDVTLPESRMERLERYEQTADPMKEFGKDCLTNSAEDYLVKADVTTVYEEYASDKGHELGSNTHDNLHEALRGMHGLDYTQSYPGNPDYEDTSLPLRGWDKRKYVVDRMSLTETGLEYAEAAGLVESDTADTGQRYITDVSAGMHTEPLCATLAEEIEPPEWLQGKGHLVDGEGGLMPYEVEAGTPLAGVQKDETVLIENVKVENRDGVLTAVLSGITEVTTETDDEPLSPVADDAQTDLANTATDGGELETPKAKVAQHIQNRCEKGDTVSVAKIASKIEGLSPDDATSALETIQQEMRLLTSTGDDWRVL